MKDNDFGKITFKKFILHLHTVNKHRFLVFKLCQYSYTEFIEGVKYYSGDHSPIENARKCKGYSEAWLHHRGRNKHHFEYWIDSYSKDKTPIIPYKYFVEMVCDTLAAGLTYKKKNWKKDYQLNYWMRVRKYAEINPKIDFLLTRIYTEVSEKGINKTITRKNMEYLYRKYMGFVD